MHAPGRLSALALTLMLPACAAQEEATPIQTVETSEAAPPSPEPIEGPLVLDFELGSEPDVVRAAITAHNPELRVRDYQFNFPRDREQRGLSSTAIDPTTLKLLFQARPFLGMLSTDTGSKGSMRERMWLAFTEPPGEGKLWGIRRDLTYQNPKAPGVPSPAAPGAEATRAALIERYGTPTAEEPDKIMSQHGRLAERMRWLTGPQSRDCLGKESRFLPSGLTTNEIMHPEAWNEPSACSPVVAALLISIGDRVSALHVHVIDVPTYIRNQQANLRAFRDMRQKARESQ